MTKNYYRVEVIRKMCESDEFYVEADNPNEATEIACNQEDWEPVFGPWREEEHEVKEVSIEEWKEGNK
jgi:hypothetical protein